MIVKPDSTEESQQSSFEKKALILMYHRVAEARSDPWSLHVSPQHFGEQLEILQKTACVISLQRLTEDLERKGAAKRTVVVTFDDGYADNLYNARPLLERYDAPATMFIVSGQIGDDREFWWDELERIFLEPRALPESLDMNIGEATFEWKIKDAVDPDSDWFRIHRYWKAWQDPPSSRHSLYYSLWRLLRSLSENERSKKLNEIRLWAGIEPEGRASHRSLSAQELLSLAKGELVEVGCHTVTHPRLSTLTSIAQQEEIQNSKAGLEELIGRPVREFAYPFGGQDDYSEDTIALVRKSGFTTACSTIPGLVAGNADLFQLPRVQVEDWDGEEFERQLSTWFGD